MSLIKRKNNAMHKRTILNTTGYGLKIIKDALLNYSPESWEEEQHVQLIHDIQKQINGIINKGKEKTND